MSKDLTEKLGVGNNRLRSLIGFYARKPEEWNRSLPRRAASVTYFARDTLLSSGWPLFAVTYELWFSLNYTGLDRSDVKLMPLAQLRMILEILWDAGTVRHVNWDVGNADRWDDYWTLVNRLATESCNSLGWSSACEEQQFHLELYLSAVYVEGGASTIDQPVL